MDTRRSLPDHPGDTLAHWLLGAAVDDATNEEQRVDDAGGFVIDAVFGDRPGLDLIPEVDVDRVAVAGHSYGGFTVLVPAGAEQTDRGCAVSPGWSRSRGRCRGAPSGVSMFPC